MRELRTQKGKNEKSKERKCNNDLQKESSEEEMNIKEIVKVIAKREGLKKEVSVGNIREIVGIVCDLMLEDSTNVLALVINGQLRAAKRKKK